MTIRTLRDAVALAGLVLFLGVATRPAAADEGPSWPCAAAQPDVAALVAGAEATATADVPAQCTAGDSRAEGMILDGPTAKPTRLGYCRCGCGVRCTSDADCGPGGSCVAFISCC